MKSRVFYQAMKEERGDTLSYCFDLQEVQSLPKSPDSDDFYLKQLGYYTLCIVQSDGKNLSLYTWTEDKAGRESTEVASALINFLNNQESLANHAISNIILFCAGCGGQSENFHAIHALTYWLYTTEHNNIKTATVTYPVRGYSFLPLGRILGRIEKIIRKKTFIKTKKQNHRLFFAFLSSTIS